MDLPRQRIFVGEFLCGGGMCDTAVELIPASLLGEGELMWRALIDDISQWADVTTPVDPRLSLQRDELNASCVAMNLESRPWSQWIDAAHGCDQVVIVAPETDCLLTQGIVAFRSAGFNVMALSNSALRMASDKWQTAKWLHREGIPHPESWAWDPSGHTVLHSTPIANPLRSESERYWVKPRDGCGAIGVRCYNQFDQAIESMQPYEMTQRHAEGRPASILGVGNGTDHSYALMPAVWQRMQPLTDEGCENGWAYQGGVGPVAADVQHRAEVLAERLIGTLPGKWSGFVGIDWIAADDPSSDCVIEVNPRLTTSYIGVRQIVQENVTRRLIQPSDDQLLTGDASELVIRSMGPPKSSAATESIEWSINQSH